eukprot:SAG31_NODE_1974_length_6755_cov_6.833383_6_plen_198_part_00
MRWVRVRLPVRARARPPPCRLRRGARSATNGLAGVGWCRPPRPPPPPPSAVAAPMSLGLPPDTWSRLLGCPCPRPPTCPAPLGASGRGRHEACRGHRRAPTATCVDYPANMLFYAAALAAGVVLLRQAASTLAVPAPMTWGLRLGLLVVLAVSSAAAVVAAVAATLAAWHWRKWRGSGNAVSKWVRRLLAKFSSFSL